MKLKLISLLDWFDWRVLEHRFPRLCAWIVWHPWWEESP